MVRKRKQTAGGRPKPAPAVLVGGKGLANLAGVPGQGSYGKGLLISPQQQADNRRRATGGPNRGTGSSGGAQQTEKKEKKRRYRPGTVALR